jgi:hypothetical protein
MQTTDLGNRPGLRIHNAFSRVGKNPIALTMQVAETLVGERGVPNYAKRSRAKTLILRGREPTILSADRPRLWYISGAPIVLTNNCTLPALQYRSCAIGLLVTDGAARLQGSGGKGTEAAG